MNWCEVAFNSVAQWSAAYGQMVLDSKAPSFLPVMKQELKKSDTLFTFVAVYLFAIWGQKKKKEKKQQFLF